MKLLLANNYFYNRGGAEKVFFGQKELFQRKGHKVFSFSQLHPDNLHDGHQHWFPPWSDPKRAGLIKAFPRFLKFVYSPGNRRLFRKYLQWTKPDLVHAHNLYGGLTTAILDAAADLGVPVVMTLHDYKIISPSPNLLSGNDPCRNCLVRPGTPECLLKRCHRGSWRSTFAYYWETWFNRRYRKYDSVKTFVVPSQFVGNMLVTAGLNPDRIRVVPNTVGSNPPAAGERGDYFLFAARMEDEKGVEILLKALDGFPAKLVLAGDGPRLKHYKGRAAGRNNIEFTGHLNPKRMEEHYQNCLAVVIPSLWPETSSMVALQAMSLGKPVVASRIGALSELVEEGVTGFLVEPGNAGQLARVLERLESEPGLAERMGTAAREMFEKRYSQDRQYQMLIEIYEGVLGKGGLAEGLTANEIPKELPPAIGQ